MSDPSGSGESGDAMTDLQEAFASEHGPVLRASLVERFARLEARLAAAVAAGLAPEEFGRAEAAQRALRTARRVLE